MRLKCAKKVYSANAYQSNFKVNQKNSGVISLKTQKTAPARCVLNLIESIMFSFGSSLTKNQNTKN
jgi:hypothetical protein